MSIPSCVLVADFAIETLAPFLTEAAPSNCAVVPAVAPFDQVVATLLDDDAPCWRSKPDFAFVWTRPSSAVPSFGRLVDNESVREEDILTEVDAFAACLRHAARRVDLLFVATWTWPPYDRLVGPLNHDTAVGPLYLLNRMNSRLAEAVAPDGRTRLLDATRWVALGGADGSASRLWHMGKFAFGPAVLRAAAVDLQAAIQAARGRARKVLVLDLDDTLWGGEVGEAGWEAIVLGGHDPAGEAFQAFQRRLKALSRRGIALAIASKNTEAVALDAIDRHPEMVLRRPDFAAWEINWHDKAENVERLARRLNVGLDALVFVDNSPFERARVRAALPAVYVPEWPADVLQYPQALAELTCFDAVAITGEDARRSLMYAEERARHEARHTVESLDEYLRSLDLRVTVERVAPATLTRAAQLLNKTNQMNLATRRLPEAAFAEWIDGAGRQAFTFRVADRHGDSGLTGLATFETDGSRTATVIDFVVSCRVMGRGVERTMVALVVEAAAAAGLAECRFPLTPTDRNEPCKAFFDGESGLVTTADHEYRWPLAEPYPPAPHVTVDRTRLSASRLPLRITRQPHPAPPPAGTTTEIVAFQCDRERRLAALIGDLLGVAVGRDDSFFDCGGSSLSAAELVFGIRANLGCDLTLIDVYDTPTVAGLARKCDAAARAVTARRRGRVVEVQPAGARHPFFFVHAAVEGDGFYCYDIARHLGPDQPFYALPPHGLDGHDVPARVADMAAENVRAVKNVQPAGPYQIGGFCKSALVALEMARQLRDAGDDVELVVVMASGVANTSAIARALDAATARVAQLFGWSGERTTTAYLMSKEALEWLQDMARERRWRRFPTSRAGANPAMVLPGAACAGEASQARRHRIEAQYARALAAYVPRPYSGRLACLVPAEEELDGRWGKIARRMSVHVVPGGHDSCVIAHADALAATLATCFRGEAAAGQPA